MTAPAARRWPLPQADPSRERVVALAGNPNTGKSTVFNALTGLRQHTGNWPGKTVARAEGKCECAGARLRLIDLPGTYSLLATSTDEEIARDFLLFGQPDLTLVVIDATRLHRNLNLVLQVLAITDRVVVCLNLMDEARRHGVTIDVARLQAELGVPVVPTAARFEEGLAQLRQTLVQALDAPARTGPRLGLRWPSALQNALDELIARLRAIAPGLPNAPWVALRLLDGDASMIAALESGRLLTLNRGASEPPDADPDAVRSVLDRASALRWEVGPDFHQEQVETIFAEAARITDACVTHESGTTPRADRFFDRWLTGRWTGYPTMALLLAGVLWLTIAAANYPSRLLSGLLLETVHPALWQAATRWHVPAWLAGLSLDGVYLATAWVVCVMLPPMAIFFPLFTLLEDLGLLPRIAFNLDRFFAAVGGHGKQALTLCMGLGCNAAGVVACRIIDSPRERLIAILTNNFALCNGRWPTQILLASLFLGALAPAAWSAGIATAAVAGVALLGLLLTGLTTGLLARTLLRGEASTFQLELPPYRRPHWRQTLVTSLRDRTLFVLWRAIVFAAPAGAVIWLIGHVSIGERPLALLLADGLDPIGRLIGLNGLILLAYLVALPANEIVIPTVLMLITLSLDTHAAQGGVLSALEGPACGELLRAGGWTTLTAVCVMLFSLAHNPCSTTLFTVWKETGSRRWTLLAALIPLAWGFVLCFLVAQFWRLFAGPGAG